MNRAVRFFLGLFFAGLLAISSAVAFISSAAAECRPADAIEASVMQAAGLAVDWGRRVQLEPPSCEQFKNEYPQLLSSAQQLIAEGESCLDPESTTMDYALQVKGALEQASSHC